MSVHIRWDEENRDTITSPRGSKRRLRAFPLKQRAMLRRLTAELDSLRERIEVARRQAFMLSLDDNLQSLSEALQTAVADLRHAQAALGWLASADEAKVPADRAPV